MAARCALSSKTWGGARAGERAAAAGRGLNWRRYGRACAPQRHSGKPAPVNRPPLRRAGRRLASAGTKAAVSGANGFEPAATCGGSWHAPHRLTCGSRSRGTCGSDFRSGWRGGQPARRPRGPRALVGREQGEATQMT